MLSYEVLICFGYAGLLILSFVLSIKLTPPVGSKDLFEVFSRRRLGR